MIIVGLMLVTVGLKSLVMDVHWIWLWAVFMLSLVFSVLILVVVFTAQGRG